jgi:hypothetical protein
VPLTAFWLIPVAAAIDRVDQCVAFAGCSSSVLTITRSTSSSVIVRGLPGRGSSCNLSSRCVAKRPRHLLTVVFEQPIRAAMSIVLRPSAAAKTIRHRNADAWELFGRRAHRSNTSRSLAVNTNSARLPIAASIVVGDNGVRGLQPRFLRTNDSDH